MFSSLSPNVKTIDVTAIVQARLDANFDTVHFRGRFENSSNENGVVDRVNLKPGQLRITYSLPGAMATRAAFTAFAR